ncbi:S8 family peptidase [Hamadaea sp. NPDC051192]|uniref:S8 family peptidase n=1 Tax=Hamadaea sp. NPDC051192 TaxID=3154940 RepID=UPI0034148F8E
MNLQRQAAHRLAVGALAVVTMAGLTVILNGSATAAPGGAADTATYIVQTAGQPIATYAGDRTGFKATKPGKGKKVDAHSPEAKAYAQRLSSDHDAALRAAGVSSTRKGYDYQTVFNGFSAQLTQAEAARLAKTAGVTAVWANETVHADTVTTPSFLGLTGDGGVWQQQFGGVGHAGEGVIVGIIDSGIWPENPAFAPLAEPRTDSATIAAKWHGTCDAGVTGTPVACNNKLIGARYFKAAGQGSIQPVEFFSPRDYDGHGTHTASTAAGNNNVPASINGSPVGSISGMAPAARIAAYKALWENAAHDGASGSTVDLVAAINQAVSDGVDVINYSISGSTTSVVNAVEVAFFNATAAGVFVATSAGNDGPGVSTVAHNAPWTATVAASTHPRGNQKTIVLGNGAQYTGVGVVTAAVPSSPLINSAAIPAAGQTVANATLCMPGSIDAAQATGKIVICTRGTNARVEKGQVVKDAGGVGMILANTAAAPGLVGDFHAVPTVQVEAPAGDAIKAYAATAGATASLTVTDPTPVEAPLMAGFSSTGPALAGGGDLLKPDITAPGVDVIAAISPAKDGNNFNAESGTSMSSPHIAGLAALLKSANPGWDPITIKSALMTTAYQLDNKGNPIQTATGAAATPLNFGAGHVQPASAFNPGLVYESGPVDWLAYLCAIGQGAAVGLDCSALPAIDPSDLNYPSISVGDLVGSQTITRTVTNITNRDSKYTPTVVAPAGVTVSVSPAILKVDAGQSATYKVTLTRSTAALGSWAFGSISWYDKATGHRDHTVRSPIAVRPVAYAAPTEVVGTGSATIPVKVGYTGTLNASLAGLVPATVTTYPLDMSGPSFVSTNPAASSRTAKVTVTVPAGSIGRFGTYAADYSDTTDLDVFAYAAGTNTLAGQAADGDSEELITLGPGTYDVYYDLFAGDPITNVKGHVYLLGSTATGNATINPASVAVATGQTVPVTVTGSGLTAGLRYLGRTTLTDGTTTLGRPFVTITG